MEPIIIDGEKVEITGPRTARVASRSEEGKWYAVDLDDRNGTGSCTCKGFEYTRGKGGCRHLKAVRRFADGEADTALLEDETLVPVTLFTSRYMNRDVIGERPELVPVGITVGKPRFIAHLPYRDRLVYVDELAPRGLLQVDSDEEFARLYRQRLDEIGVAAIKRRLSRVAQEAGSAELVLLCYEKVHLGESCHRRMFADWWFERTQETVPGPGTTAEQTLETIAEYARIVALAGVRADEPAEKETT
jgi:hypothetical protein